MEGDDVNLGDVILSLRADDTARHVRQAELNLQSRQLDLARGKSSPRDEDIEIARASLRKATMAVAAAEASYNANPSTQNDAAREITRADLDIARANFNRVTNWLVERGNRSAAKRGGVRTTRPRKRQDRARANEIDRAVHFNSNGNHSARRGIGRRIHAARLGRGFERARNRGGH